MTETAPDWRDIANRALAEKIASQEEFTSDEIASLTKSRGATLDNQFGNFLNSWKGKGAIRKTGDKIIGRGSRLIHVWEGVYVSAVTRYQVMPPLSPDEYQELYDSIKSEGVHEPVHIDEDGVIIDGHHRSKIAKELGIPCPVITHDGLSESKKRSLAFTLNLKRRHLNREQRRALGLESLRLDPIASNREHSKRTGLSDKTIQAIREDENIPEPKDVIREYKEDHPDKSLRKISEELDVHRNTVRDALVQNSETPNFVPDKEVETPQPTTSIISHQDLEELNQLPTEKPTMEPQDEKITFTRRGTKATKNQLKAADRLSSQIEAITIALEYEFPVRVFDKTFTKDKSVELAQALRKATRKLSVHINRLEEFAKES